MLTTRYRDRSSTKTITMSAANMETAQPAKSHGGKPSRSTIPASALLHTVGAGPLEALEFFAVARREQSALFLARAVRVREHSRGLVERRKAARVRTQHGHTRAERRVALQPLRAGVPAGDMTIRRELENRIVQHAIDQQAEKVRLGFLARGHRGAGRVGLVRHCLKLILELETCQTTKARLD